MAGACFIGFAIGESLGASALRVAGGIFTKIADIGSDLMKIFNQSYDFILKINDIEQMKDVISQLIDLYESLYTDFDLRQENDKTAACKDFLFRMIEEYEEIYKLKDLDEIKTRITKIKLREEVNIRQLAETYEIPAYNFDVVDKLMKLYRNRIKFSPSKDPYITFKISDMKNILGECKDFLSKL